MQPFLSWATLLSGEDGQTVFGVVAIRTEALFAKIVGQPPLMQSVDDDLRPVGSIRGGGVEDGDGETIAQQVSGAQFFVVGDSPMDFGINGRAEISKLVGLHAGQGNYLSRKGVLVLESSIADALGGDAKGLGDTLHEFLCCLASAGDAHKKVVANTAGVVQWHFFHDEMIGFDLDFAAGSRQFGRDEG